MEYENLSVFLKYLEQGGPLVGVLLPVIEAFIPVLPLIGFVIINVAAFGFVLGYLYSWMGNCIGSFLLFLFIRKVGGKKFEEKKKKANIRELSKK